MKVSIKELLTSEAVSTKLNLRLNEVW